eukprot:scaffold5067_cov245-Pinguiococcus_pyrenoidosus.AAC.12
MINGPHATKCEDAHGITWTECTTNLSASWENQASLLAPSKIDTPTLPYTTTCWLEITSPILLRFMPSEILQITRRRVRGPYLLPVTGEGVAEVGDAGIADVGIGDVIDGIAPSAATNAGFCLFLYAKVMADAAIPTKAPAATSLVSVTRDTSPSVRKSIFGMRFQRRVLDQENVFWATASRTPTRAATGT